MATEEVVLDPGPVVWGEVTFVAMRHPETGGTMDAPPALVAHYEGRGWETYEPPSPAEVAEAADKANLRMSREELDELAREAGVIEPEEFRSKAEVIAAIEALDPTTTNQPSEED